MLKGQKKRRKSKGGIRNLKESKGAKNSGFDSAREVGGVNISALPDIGKKLGY